MTPDQCRDIVKNYIITKARELGAATTPEDEEAAIRCIREGIRELFPPAPREPTLKQETKKRMLHRLAGMAKLREQRALR